MRCPSCNKFATYNTSNEPEIEVQIEGSVLSGTARIVLTSECCEEELKEATFDIEKDLEDELSHEVRKCLGLLPDSDVDLEELSFEADVSSCEITERLETEKTRTLKNGEVRIVKISPRSAKTFYGFSAEITITGDLEKDGKKYEISMQCEVSDDIQASDMDELV